MILRPAPSIGKEAFVFELVVFFVVVAIVSVHESRFIGRHIHHWG
jgi:hypothetical protein